MSYVLKCYNKSRNITDEYSLNNDGDNSFRLLLGDAFSFVIDCFVLNDTKLVNTFDISFETVDWLIIKRDYVDIEKSKNDNFSSRKRNPYELGFAEGDSQVPWKADGALCHSGM